MEVSNAEVSLLSLLTEKVKTDPFRLVTLLIFLGALVHTFLAGKFARKAKVLEQHAGVTVRSQCLHWLGEVEVIFGLWLIPLTVCFILFKGWTATVNYFTTRHYSEPIFVFVIMMTAATRPVLYLAERVIQSFVRLFGGEKPSTWWFCILIIAPLFGSLITEPAAMTIAALLLSQKVFAHKPNALFSYATLGLLFVNVSVGGSLTHFAAPPILMVARPWHWDTPYVFSHFGKEAVCWSVLSRLLYGVLIL